MRHQTKFPYDTAAFLMNVCSGAAFMMTEMVSKISLLEGRVSGLELKAYSPSPPQKRPCISAEMPAFGWLFMYFVFSKNFLRCIQKHKRRFDDIVRQMISIKIHFICKRYKT